jgi:hypothetical protein
MKAYLHKSEAGFSEKVSYQGNKKFKGVLSSDVSWNQGDQIGRIFA